MTTSRELPKYQCHKKVWALKIKDVTYDRPPLEGVPRGNATITPEDEGYEPFVVDEVWAMKNRPQPGGYYVAYEDGYKSYSPAPAFEAGYSLLSCRSELSPSAQADQRIEAELVAAPGDDCKSAQVRVADWLKGRAQP